MIHLTIHRHLRGLLLLIAAFTLGNSQKAIAQKANTENPPALSILTLDKAIDEMVAKLSLEQKVGQMTQIDLGVIAVGSPCGLQQPQTLDKAKLREAIEKYHIGSVLKLAHSHFVWHRCDSWCKLYRRGNDVSTANRSGRHLEP
ncbi:MAG: hypothetical protein EB003_11175 [Flavobacteriia bacterium]|nr:hypothetical protein [Flavobacteriia bacterium]